VISFALALAAATALPGCGMDRTFFGPDLPKTTEGARSEGNPYPNVFAKPAPRPPLLSKAEQEAEKRKLEQSRPAP